MAAPVVRHTNLFILAFLLVRCCCLPVARTCFLKLSQDCHSEADIPKRFLTYLALLASYSLTDAVDYHAPMLRSMCHNALEELSTDKSNCQRLCDDRDDDCKGYAYGADTGKCTLCASTKPRPGSQKTYFKQEFTCAATIFERGDVKGDWAATYVGDESEPNYYSSYTHSDYDFHQGFISYGAKNDQMSSIKVVGKDCIAAVFKHQHFNGWEGTYATEGDNTVASFDKDKFVDKTSVSWWESWEVDNHASSIKVRKLNCGRTGDGWVNGRKDGLKAGTEDIIDNCPAKNSDAAKSWCADKEYAFHKCPVSCGVCDKSQIMTSTSTQTSVTATTETTTETTTATTATTTVTTATRTTLTYTNSKTTVTETTATQTTATHTTKTSTMTTTETSTTSTETATTRTGTTMTLTTITLTTTTLGAPTFPIGPLNKAEDVLNLFNVVKQLLEDACYPDNTFKDAFNDDRIRLKEQKSGKQTIWDGGSAPEDAEFPLWLNIWVDESQRGTKPNCSPPTQPPIVSGTEHTLVGWATMTLLLVGLRA